LIIPLHEEVLYLSECGISDITDRLFAAPFMTIYQLHNKWEFSKLLDHCKLDRPEAYLCSTRADIDRLDASREWAIKPNFGRATTGVQHMKPGKELDWNSLDVSPGNPYIAQEWLKGNRYCTYCVTRDGRMTAFCIYPVLETIDGSSSVYFEAVEHQEIRDYVVKLVTSCRLTGQFAFDFVETGVWKGEIKRAPHGIPHGKKYRELGERLHHHQVKKDSSSGQSTTSHSVDHRLVAIECNPRATSGIHLWSRSPRLAMAMTDTSCDLVTLDANSGVSRQTAPGMLMWEHSKASLGQYYRHLKRMIGTKDVMWSWKDFGPVFTQPFLLASYYRICHEKGGMPLPEMFQADLIWEPGKYGESQKLGLSGDNMSRPVEELAPDAVLRPRTEMSNGAVSGANGMPH
jgi:hypothetical protein